MQTETYSVDIVWNYGRVRLVRFGGSLHLVDGEHITVISKKNISFYVAAQLGIENGCIVCYITDHYWCSRSINWSVPYLPLNVHRSILSDLCQFKTDDKMYQRSKKKTQIKWKTYFISQSPFIYCYHYINFA